MAFKTSEVEDLLVQTGRHCCICQLLHLVQLHHIIPIGEGGTDEVDNAIPLCPLCHDQVHANSAPGRVTKSYSHSELKQHRQRTIDMMQKLPAMSPLPPASVGTHQSVPKSHASAISAQNVLRSALRLRNLIMSARTPAVLGSEEEAGRRILQASNISADGKTSTELIWYNRWKPIQEANAELSKEALEAEIFFGAEARELIWNLQLLIGYFGIDLNAYLKWCSGESRGPDPVREQLYKAVYNVAGSGEVDEFGEKVHVAVDGIADYFRPRI